MLRQREERRRKQQVFLKKKAYANSFYKFVLPLEAIGKINYLERFQQQEEEEEATPGPSTLRRQKRSNRLEPAIESTHEDSISGQVKGLVSRQSAL